MNSTRILAFAVVTAFPAGLFAQIKPTVAISVPTATPVIKSVTLADVAGLPGTGVSGTTSIGSPPYICGCIVAKGTAPAMTVHFGDGSVHAPAMQAGFSLSHDVPHSLTIALNGADIFGLLCNGKGSLRASPNFAGLGASSDKYRWELRESGKVVKTGYGSGGGEGIIIDDGSHTAGEMQFGITDHGVITLYHGTHMLVITPEATDIGAKTGGSLQFKDLGVRAGGVTEFTVISPALVSGVQPPGSRQ